MSRTEAQSYYDRREGEPQKGYVTPTDAQAALGVVYRDMDTGDQEAREHTDQGLALKADKTALSAHTAATTGVHGITDTAQLATKTDIAAKADKTQVDVLNASIGNRLTPNQAAAGDALGTTEGFGAWNCTLTYSGGSVVATKTSAAGDMCNVSIDQIAVMPGEVITVDVQAANVSLTEVGPTTRGTVCIVTWQGVSVPHTPVFDWGAAPVREGQVTVTVPAGCTRASIGVYAHGNPGEQFRVTRFGVWRGTGGQWAMPGQPILGLTDALAGIGNLLTDNRAKPTTVGGWPTLGGCTETAPGVYTATGTASIEASLSAQRIPATEGVVYTAHCKATTTGGRQFRAVLRWYNAAGASLSLNYGPYVASGQVSQVSAVAPAGAVSIHAYGVATGLGVAGDTATILEAGLWRGAGGDWAMPGTPITNQAVLPVTQTPVPQTKLWAGSSWAPRAVIIGSGSPLNIVVPDFKGQEYVDTQQTLGARKWVATGMTAASWVVSDGDTGWYDIAPIAAFPATATVVQCRLRRTTSMVHLALDWADTQANPARQQFLVLPDAVWYPVYSVYGRIDYDAAANTPYRTVWVPSAGALTYGGPTGTARFMSIVSWPAKPTWPTSAPV